MRLLLLLALLASPVFTVPLAQAAGEHPKLILTIVIDQFRADYLTRFESRFGAGGFKRLMSEGAYFPMGQYDLLQNMTGPGHSTVLSGSYPYQSGLAINYWYNPRIRDIEYCTEDRTQALVGVPAGGPSAKDVHLGTSPRNFLGDTVGDELKNAGFPSRVVSVSLKDRAAILLGGHRADLALWNDSRTHRWVSSHYYLKDGKLPAWVDALNAGLAEKEGKTFTWQHPQGAVATGYTHDNHLPHTMKFGSHDYGASPFAEEDLELAAEKAFDAYGIGRGRSIDLFAVSFSAHDYAAHAWGPNSLELEDMTAAEDRLIAKLLAFVGKRVPGGLKDVVVVFTADHGGPPDPDWLKDAGMDAGRIDEVALAKKISGILADKHGKPENGDWIVFAKDFNFWLNPQAIIDKKLKREEVENETRALLLQVPGVAHVVTRTDYENRRLPPLMHERQILKTYYPERSGDLILIPKSYYMKPDDRVDHLTGYSYDRTVPIILMGPGIRAGKYPTRAEVVDIAPTLSFLTGTIAPALNEGRVLSEILSSPGSRGQAGH